MFLVKKLLKNKFFRTTYLAWFSMAFFFFYQYILRVCPAVMVEDLREAFKINANEFATFGSFYLVGYSLLQIPLGIIVDRIGVKKMSLHSILICIFSSLIFGFTTNFTLAQFSRFIMGIGSASALMCTLKYVADHFPPGKRGVLMGATLSFGMAGAILTGKSTQLLGNHLGWYQIVGLTTVIGVIGFVLILFAVKPALQDPYSELNKRNLSDIVVSLKQIISSKEIVIYATLAVGFYTPLAALTDLWGPAFIKQKFSLSVQDASLLTTQMYYGLIIGSLLLPFLAEKFNRLNEVIILSALSILLIFSVVIYLPPVNKSTLSILLTLLGIFCGVEMMCFTGALSYSKKMNSGEIIGVVNTLNMLGGAFLQQAIGWGLDYQWNDGLIDSNGLRLYSTRQFELSLSILAFLVLFCSIVSFQLLNFKSSKQID